MAAPVGGGKITIVGIPTYGAGMTTTVAGIITIGAGRRLSYACHQGPSSVQGQIAMSISIVQYCMHGVDCIHTQRIGWLGPA